LAKKYNIEIQERELNEDEKREQSERESMFIVNEWACQYFHEILKNDVDGQAIGKQYFRSRGIRDDIIEKFQLGFALTKRDALANEAKRKGYQQEFLVKTGLCGENEKGLYDRFAGRAIFPWLNVSGKVVAFGGRVLDSRTKGVAQKYVNSPDSDIYHKERELYGIYQAKKAIVKEDRVFMVEGYTDVIAMHQAGIENVVANSGTALSQYQIRILHRFTSNITLLYDGDEAGIHAALRGTDMLLQDGMNVKVLLLPDGDDPDSFARKHSTDELRRYIDEHQEDFISFKTHLTVDGVSDPVQRSKAISGIVKSISVVPDPILRSTYLSQVSSNLGLKESTLMQSMNGYIRQEVEEREKAAAREAAREQGLQGVPDNPDSQSVPDSQNVQSATGVTMVRNTPNVQSSRGGQDMETQLIREVIRHGDEVIYDNVETDDGQTISLTVAQYLDYDLGQDGLTFENPLYNQILAEAVEHSGQQGWHAMAYFTNHPDIAVSQLATQLSVDRHHLGGRFVVAPREGSLCQRVLQLVMGYRLQLVEARLKAIQRELRTVGADRERMMQLLQEHKETKELCEALAKKLGREIIV
jgi:DNA primase